ncbi:MAG: hypothetical protein RLZZ230_872 [Candidatus Parcubacteria bacterium]|jgi:hypothetical protein
METEELPQRVATILGVEKMTKDEQQAFLDRVGMLIIDSSINRLLLTLNEEEVSQLEKYVTADSEVKDTFSGLLDLYPQLESIVQEEAIAFQTETVEVMG